MHWLVAIFLVSAVLASACSEEVGPDSSAQSGPATDADGQDQPESAQLAIILEPTEAECALDVDRQGSTQVRWSVEGGTAPYEVWVDGELREGATGSLEVACAGPRLVDEGSGELVNRGLPLTVVGTVFDAEGVRASDLLLLRRPGAVLDADWNRTREFEGRVDTLTLELFAPSICEAEDWTWIWRLPFVGTGADDISMEIEWQNSGGKPPYTLFLAGGEFEGESGTLRLQCRYFEGGGSDTGWITVPALARDSVGAIGSAMVQTLALAHNSSTREHETEFLNGGKAYRLLGMLMTIPEGITLDLREEGIPVILHECEEDEDGNEVFPCEASTRLVTTGGSLVVWFALESRLLYKWEILDSDWRSDPGIRVETREELDELMDQWADSIGQSPDLSAARWLNPAPLRISGYADPLICDPIDQIGRVYINVAGGAWVPTGIKVDGELVGLARGSGTMNTYAECSLPPGIQRVHLNVHDLGPDTDTSFAETEIDIEVPPDEQGSDELKLGIGFEYGEPRNRIPATSYCAPGSTTKVLWRLIVANAPGTIRSVMNPVSLRIGDQFVDTSSGYLQDDSYRQSGGLWVRCQESLGRQVVKFRGRIPGNTTEAAELLVPLQIVETHPSGLDWSEIRPDDYPDE